MSFDIVIDWFTISGHFDSFEDMLKFVGLNGSDICKDFQRCPGINFFEDGYSYYSEGRKSISLYMGQANNPDLCMIDFSGRGCRLFESYSTLDFNQLFERCMLTDKINCSRIDLALDIRDSEYPIDKFYKAYDKGNFRSISRNNSVTVSDSNGIKGTSLYFGGRDSPSRINIYDKRAERGYTDRELPDGWVRMELRLRHYNAMSCIEELWKGTDIATLYYSIINDKLAFLRRSRTDTNKSRWALAPWWSKLLKQVEYIHFIQPGIDYDYSRWEEQFFKQCGSRLATYLEMHVNPYDLLKKIRERDIHPSPEQKKLIQNYDPELEWKEYRRI